MVTKKVAGLSLGLVTNLPPLLAPLGSLSLANNVHFNLSSSLETRPNLTEVISTPANAFGMHTIGSDVFLFGTTSAPVAPGNGYQVANINTSLTPWKILNILLVLSKWYLVVEFTNGDVLHFYDGDQITGLVDVRARAPLTFSGTNGSVTSIKVEGEELLNNGPITLNNTLQGLVDAVADDILFSSSSLSIEPITQELKLYLKNRLPGTALSDAPVVLTTGDIAVATSAFVGGGSVPNNKYLTSGAIAGSGSRVYIGDNNLVVVSAINDPTDYTPGSSDDEAFNFDITANPGPYLSGITALAVLNNRLVVYTAGGFQVWNDITSQDDLTFVESFSVNGVISRRGAGIIKNASLLFFARSGVYVLDPQKFFTDTLNLNIMSQSITNFIEDLVRNCSCTSIQDITFITDPSSNRWYFFVDNRVLVLSQTGSKSTAFTTYSFDSMEGRVLSVADTDNYVYILTTSNLYYLKGESLQDSVARVDLNQITLDNDFSEAYFLVNIYPLVEDFWVYTLKPSGLLNGAVPRNPVPLISRSSSDPMAVKQRAIYNELSLYYSPPSARGDIIKRKTGKVHALIFEFD